MNERIQKEEALSLVIYNLYDERGCGIFRTTINPRTGSYSMFWQLKGDYADYSREAERVIKNFVPENSPVQIRKLSPSSTPLEAKSTVDLQSVRPDEETCLISIKAGQITLFFIKGETGKIPIVGFRTKANESVLLGAFVRSLSATQTTPGIVEELLEETVGTMTNPDQH